MNQFEFPNYLAFGKLDTKSIRTEDEFQVADYYLLNEKVQEVKVSEKSAQFIESFQGNEGSFTCHHTLEKAILHQFMCWKPSSSVALDYLVRQTSSLGNIHFEPISNDRKRRRFVFYPAGLFFVFRIPVTSSNLSALFENTLDPVISKYRRDFHITQVITVKLDDSLETENINLLELLVPMAQVYDVARHLVEKKIILPDKKYQMIIHEASEASTGMHQSFYTDGNDPWKAYAIKLKSFSISGD